MGERRQEWNFIRIITTFFIFSSYLVFVILTKALCSCIILIMKRGIFCLLSKSIHLFNDPFTSLFFSLFMENRYKERDFTVSWYLITCYCPQEKRSVRNFNKSVYTYYFSYYWQRIAYLFCIYKCIMCVCMCMTWEWVIRMDIQHWWSIDITRWFIT